MQASPFGSSPQAIDTSYGKRNRLHRFGDGTALVRVSHVVKSRDPGPHARVGREVMARAARETSGWNRITGARQPGAPPNRPAATGGARTVPIGRRRLRPCSGPRGTARPFSGRARRQVRARPSPRHHIAWRRDTRGPSSRGSNSPRRTPPPTGSASLAAA